MRDTLTSPRVLDMKRKRRTYRIRLGIFIFILLVSFVAALAYFSSHPRITLSTVVVSGTQIINPAHIESLVKEDLQGKYIRLFARANSFIYPRKKIYSDIMNLFPRIETLAVYRDNLTTLHIVLTERAGSYLYCGQEVPEAQIDVGENCYFINSDGYVFDKAPYFSGNVYFKYYIALLDSAGENPLRSQILPRDRFHELLQFVDEVTVLGFKPTYIVIDKEGTAFLYLAHTSSATTPKIIFKNTDLILTMLDNLSTAMAKKEFASEINSKYTTLLYIDLRFNNKVIYKFQ